VSETEFVKADWGGFSGWMNGLKGMYLMAEIVGVM